MEVGLKTQEASLSTGLSDASRDAVELWLPVADLEASEPTLEYFLEFTPAWLAGYFAESPVLEKLKETDFGVMAKDDWLILQLRD